MTNFLIARAATRRARMTAERREIVASLWASDWTGQQIADVLGIEVKNVFGHLRALREAGDERARHRSKWLNQRRNQHLRKAA